MKTDDRTDIGQSEKATWTAVETKATALVKDAKKVAALLNEIERVCGKAERARWEAEAVKGEVPPLQTAHVLTVVDAWLSYH